MLYYSPGQLARQVITPYLHGHVLAGQVVNITQWIETCKFALDGLLPRNQGDVDGVLKYLIIIFLPEYKHERPADINLCDIVRSRELIITIEMIALYDSVVLDLCGSDTGALRWHRLKDCENHQYQKYPIIWIHYFYILNWVNFVYYKSNALINTYITVIWATQIT